MRKVSKHVKSALNESANSQTGYQLDSIEMTCQKDDYEEGCSGKTYATDISQLPRTIFPTMKDMMAYVLEHELYVDNAEYYAWEDGEILVQYMCDSEWHEISDSGIARWKKGQNDDVYAADVYVRFSKVTKSDVTIADMEAEGIEEQ